jgi:Tol biopolymer transport system component
MKKSIFCLVGCSIISFAAFTQGNTGKTSVFDNVSIEAKKLSARQSYLSGDLTTALRVYTEILNVKPADAGVAFHIGECYQEEGDNDQAVSYFEKAEKADPNCDDDLHLKLGQSYLQIVKVDDAIKELEAYKKKFTDSPKKLKESDVEHYITQCENAKQMMATPVKVIVDNLGEAVNTSYDEKSPSVTADGQTLIFTSQRPLMMSKNNNNGEVELFDNVYLSKWDTAKNRWSLSYPVEGDVNEAYGKTACTSISADGMQMFLYKNNNTDALGGDIYVARKTHSGRWGKPVSIGHPVNSTYYEDCACLSPDGNTLYFMSEKPGGYGNADIYAAPKVAKAVWGNPVNIGPVVNTKYDEGGISMAPDGKTLFFSSNGDKSMGSYDIFKTVMTDSGKWSKPVNLGYPINTVSTDVSFTISADCKTAYFASNRKGGVGGRDIYKVDLSQYPVLAADSSKSKPTGMSILRGKVTTAKGKPVEEAVVSILDSANTKIASLKTDAEGIYFITLKANCKYKVKVSSKGYKSSNTPIHLPSSPVGTFTMTQDVILQKN